MKAYKIKDFNEIFSVAAVKLNNAIFLEYEWACTLQEDMKGRLLLCCQCYSVALETAETITTDPKCEPVFSLSKRHGNILNELGVWYMNQAQSLLQKTGKITDIDL